MEVAIIRGSTKETRAAILKSAMEVFLEVGYQEASMRKIAARAGITAGAIYKHFSGKEERRGITVFPFCSIRSANSQM